MKLTPAALGLVRAPGASGIARFVAPTNPIGRVGSALAVTAVLTSVQLGLVAGHTGPDLCRLAGTCSPPEPIAGGSVLSNPSPSATKHPVVRQTRAPQIQTALPLQTVAVTQLAASKGQGAQPNADRSKDPGKSAVPEMRRAARAALSSRAAHHSHHGVKHHPSRPRT